MPARSVRSSSIRPRSETELLLLLARTRITPETAQRITTLLGGDLDWIFIVRCALSHDLLPLVYVNLRAVGHGAVPAAILDQLARYFAKHVRRNERFAKELLGLLALFDANSIPALVVKGPILAVAAYGDLSLRAFSDLDLLIHHRDAVRAQEVLIGAGFDLKTPIGRNGLPFEPGTVLGGYEYTLLREDDGLLAELRWRLTPQVGLATLDFERLRGRREVVAINGAAVPTLSAEDTLVMLCVHGAKHYWGVLKWICDVAELVAATPRMNWQQVEADARRLGYWRMVALGLELAAGLLAAPLPRDILDLIRRDGRVSQLAARVQTELLRDEEPGPGEGAAKPFRFVELMERFSDRVWNGVFVARNLLIFTVTVSPSERRFLSLPLPLRVAIYPFRCVRRLVRYGRMHFANPDW